MDNNGDDTTAAINQEAVDLISSQTTDPTLPESELLMDVDPSEELQVEEKITMPQADININTIGQMPLLQEDDTLTSEMADVGNLELPQEKDLKLPYNNMSSDSTDLLQKSTAEETSQVSRLSTTKRLNFLS